MPRARGQIDTRKSEAILVAAADLFQERGLSAPLEEVARRAKVSKQTVYNHFGSKTDLVRRLVERRRAALQAPLDSDKSFIDPVASLTIYARAMIEAVLTEPYGELLRLAVAGSLDVPELADLVYETGVIQARHRLAEWLGEADRLGMLKVDHPMLAAEMFAGMAIGGLQLRVLVQAPIAEDMAALDARARTVGALFCKAFAVEPAASGVARAGAHA